MNGYKGFDKDLKCRGLQYEVGKTAICDGTVTLCNRGLHFCEHPLDTWTYYAPLNGSRYAEVKADGVSDEKGDDSKRVAQSLTVKAEVKIPALLKAAVEFVFRKVSATTGNCAHSATTGYYAHSATTGDYAHSATTGNCAHSATTGDCAHSSAMGKNAIAAALGYQGQAKGALGNWIVLAEWKDGKIAHMGLACIDGEKIKADTFYTLHGGKFVEVEP
jgi:hypothetical protein